MSPEVTLLAVGDPFPDLALVAPDGTPTTWSAVRAPGPTIVFFMRAPTCHPSLQHLRELGAAAIAWVPIAPRAVVIVPGGAADAALVTRRQPPLAGRIFASETAHAEVGLPLEGDVQHSGNFVVGPDETVLYLRSSPEPWTAMYNRETYKAVGA